MPLRPLAALLFVLAVLTALMGQVDRFEPVGPELVTDGVFHEGLAHWTVRPPGSDVTAVAEGVRLAVDGTCEPTGFCRAHALQELSAGGGPTRVRAEAALRWSGVERPDKARGPRLHFASRADAPKSRWVWHPAFHEEDLPPDGDAVVSQDFDVWTSHPTWGLWLHLSGTAGEVVASEVSVRRLDWKGWWRAAFWVLVAGWTAAIGTALWPSARRMLASAPHAGVVLATVGILIGTLAPDGLLDPVRDQAAEVAEGLVSDEEADEPPEVPTTPVPQRAKPAKAPPEPSEVRRHIDKVGHFAGFALLALSALFAFPERKPQVVVGLLVALAPVSEVLQFLTLMRTPRVADVGLDVAGVGLGLLLWWVVCTVRARSRPEPS